MAAGLAGCADVLSGGGGGSGGAVQWGFDPTQVNENGDKIKQAMRDAGLSKDIKIEFVPGNQKTGARRDKYARLLNAGQSQPDMFLMDSGWLGTFIANGNVANLTEVLPDSLLGNIRENYFTGFVDTARGPDENLYGVPMFADFPVMQYRKDLVKNAGFQPDQNNWATEPMSWAEWSQVVKETKAASNVDYGFVTQWDIYVGTACCNFNEMMTSFGGAYFGGRDNLFGPVGERPITVNNESPVRALEVMRRFVQGDESDMIDNDAYAANIAPTEVLSWTEEDARKAQLNGRSAFMRNWPYAFASLASEDNFGTDHGAMPMPYGVTKDNAQAQGTGGPAAALGGWHTTMNPNSNKKDDVTEILKVLDTNEMRLSLLKISGWTPPKPSVFEDQEAKNIEPIGRYLDTIAVSGANSIARPITPVWDDQVTPIATQANAAVAKKRSSQKAMDNLSSTLEEIESTG